MEMTAVLYTPHFAQFFDDDGNPLSGGKLHTYLAGTNERKATYTTADGDVEHANPIILDSAGRTTIFLRGAYRFVLTDSNDISIRETDDISAFITPNVDDEPFYEQFSGDGAQTAFTLSADMGQDERGIQVFVDNTARNHVTNGTFATDTGWTKGSGWTIGSGVATASTASSALSQTAPFTLTEGIEYVLTYTATRSAGSVVPSIGARDGTSRSAAGTYTETIIAGSTQTIAFTGSGFSGTIDNVTIRTANSAGFVIVRPDQYTLNGTSLTFVQPPASGTNNVQVWSPSSLVSSAGAAQTAADAAVAAAAAAALSETAAGLSEAAAAASELAAEGFKDAAEAAAVGLENAEANAAASASAAEDAQTAAEAAAAGVSLPSLGNAHEVLKVNAGGTALEYGKTAFANIDTNAIASEVEAQAGTATDKLMTPQRVSQAIDALATSWNNFGYRSGRYYGGSFTVSTWPVAVSNNYLYIMPYIVGRQNTFDRISLTVTAFSAGNARLGIYNMANGLPTTLVLDAGTVSTGTIGQKDITISQNLPAGLYGLAALFSSTPTVWGNGDTNYPLLDHIFGSSAPGSFGGGIYRDVYTYGALPSSWGLAGSYHEPVPFIMLRST
jgi:hypothetical protein